MTTKKLEALGARGEELVAKLTGGEATPKLAPFDVVDFGAGIAYEVKTVSGMSLNGSNKIHIEQGAWNRKQAFLSEYGLQGQLMVVVVTDQNNVDVYRLPLKQHLRISTAIKTGIKLS